MLANQDGEAWNDPPRVEHLGIYEIKDQRQDWVAAPWWEATAYELDARRHPGPSMGARALGDVRPEPGVIRLFEVPP